MAKVGTPTTMPTTPSKSPPITIATSTHRADTPMDLPKILGPMILPSTCWMAIIRIRNLRASNGLTNTRISKQGIAPMKGPNTGMMLVMPTTTAISGANSMPKMVQQPKVSTPMMAESMILPPKKPSKLLLAKLQVSSTVSAIYGGKNACTMVRSWRSSLSFSASMYTLEASAVKISTTLDATPETYAMICGAEDLSTSVRLFIMLS